MPITRDEATHLGALIHAIRPDWTKTGIWKALVKHSEDHTIHELALPAIRAAYDRSLTSPAGIFFTERPHWHNPAIGQTRTQRPCEEHGDVDGGQDAYNCRMCLSEIKSDPPLRTREQLGKRIHPKASTPRPTPAMTPEAPQEA